jgi:hypothetical protein
MLTDEQIEKLKQRADSAYSFYRYLTFVEGDQPWPARRAFGSKHDRADGHKYWLQWQAFGKLIEGEEIGAVLMWLRDTYIKWATEYNYDQSVKYGWSMDWRQGLCGSADPINNHIVMWVQHSYRDITGSLEGGEVYNKHDWYEFWRDCEVELAQKEGVQKYLKAREKINYGKNPKLEALAQGEDKEKQKEEYRKGFEEFRRQERIKIAAELGLKHWWEMNLELGVKTAMYCDYIFGLPENERPDFQSWHDAQNWEGFTPCKG